METAPQASQAKPSIPNGSNGYAIPERFRKAPLFHTNRKRDRERLLNAFTTSVSTPPPPLHAKSAPPAPLRRKPKPSVVKVEDHDDAKSAAFSGPFQEFKLMSSSLNGWKYDVMKLESRKPIEVESWQRPIKLNRKEPKKGWETGEVAVGAPQAVGPMLGPDGKPVVGADGKIVMVDAEGKPIHATKSSEASSSSKPGKEKAVGGRKKFQKKTKQVYLVPEATRLLRKEERYPWVLEDSSGTQVWVGMLEDLGKAETHAMFLPTSDNVFKFVPPHRWYKFQKKPNYKIRSLEEAEILMAQFAKQKNPEQWLSQRTKAGDGSGIKKEDIANPHIPATVSLVHSSSEGLGPGGRKLKTVDSGMNGLFGDDDDEEGDFKRKREREYGADGDGDEIDFEEDFADDEEKNPDEAEDEEAKELEERIKKEYRKANNTQRDGDESEDDLRRLTGAGKAMQKMLKKNDKSGQYDESDDDEKNPYASSEEEDEEPDATQTWTGPAIQAPPPRPGAQRLPISVAAKPSVPDVGSRATSPTLGGHSLVAKRATSPKAPKPNSPLGTISRAISPVTNNKRKADEDATSPVSGLPKAKKRKGTSGELDDKLVIEWLKHTPNATTRDCILHFTRYLTDEGKKARFTALIKDVAQLKGGVLVLRNAYRGSPSAEPPGVNGS